MSEQDNVRILRQGWDAWNAHGVEGGPDVAWFALPDSVAVPRFVFGGTVAAHCGRSFAWRPVRGTS